MDVLNGKKRGVWCIYEGIHVITLHFIGATGNRL